MNADKRRWIARAWSYLRASACIGGLLLLISCEKAAPKREVVLYTSIDQPIAAPIVREFEQQTGIHVTLVTDTEATKSVGLAERLRAEKDHPQADVWWGNEPFHTINLAREGFLQPYESNVDAEIPDRFKDEKEHRWTSNGVRIRTIAISEAAGALGNVQSIEDLTDPKLKDKIAIARPTAGTTGGHVAALYVLWGDERADKYFRALRANNVKLVGGNSVVAEEVGKGKTILVGLTDNDDVAAASDAGGKLTMTIPDQHTEIGVLIVPTTIGLVTGAKHSDEAKQLIDYLASSKVETKLFKSNFIFASIREGQSPPRKEMNVNYADVARKMPDAIRRATSILEGRE